VLPPIDYSERLYAGYAEGRALTVSTVAVWRSAFGRNAQPQRPLAVLDLGCGIGRFTPLLADLFGGPVIGVEPSERMLAIARTQNAHPAVAYRKGDAAHIPLADGSGDLALLFLMFHHVPDRAAATRELARVLRPGGRVLLQSSFAGQLEDRRWFHYFPRAREIEEQMFPSFGELVEVFDSAGLVYVGIDRVACEVAPSLEAYAHKLRKRAIPSFEYLSDDEIATGFAAIDNAVAEAGGIPEPIVEPAALVVFSKTHGTG
jgi:ubiquinone/menaquinone biosynthesis C-methylase UbiE